jgi:hypothetical protein
MLLEKGDVFEIKDESDLNKIKDFIISNRANKANKSSLEELYSSYIYFCLKFYRNEFHYPLNIYKNENDPPDFILSGNVKGKVGIEVVSLSPQSLRQAISILDKMPQGSMIEVPEYTKDKNLKVNRGLKLPGEPLQSSGWAGKEPEELWLNYFRKRLNVKINKLHTYHNIYEQNYLVILDDSGYEIDFNYVIPKLQQVRQEDKEGRKFDQVHLVSILNKKIIYDIFGHLELFDYKF